MLFPIWVASSSRYWGGGGNTSTKRNSYPIFRHKGERVEFFLCLLSQLPSVQNNPYTKVTYFVVESSDLFQYFKEKRIWYRELTDWFQIRKGVYQGCILSPCLFNFYGEYIMQNARRDEAQAGIKIARRNINNLRYTDDTTLMAESGELKSLLMKMKVENEKLA